MDISTTKPEINAVVTGASPATCISFYKDNGQRLFVASAESKSLQVVDCFNAGQAIQPPIKLKQTGIQKVEATHHEDCVLLTSSDSTVGENTVHYLSVHDNKFLRAFRGHGAPVTNICMNPASDTFVTASTDGTMRLWDISSAACAGVCQLPSASSSASPSLVDKSKLTATDSECNLAIIDASGLVMAFAAEMADKKGVFLNLYDARNASAGPFAEFPVLYDDVVTHVNNSSRKENVSGNMTTSLPEGTALPWKSMEFDQSGGLVLITAVEGVAIILDGFSGKINHAWKVTSSSSNDEHHCCFATFDNDRTILLAVEGKSSVIQCWDVESIKCKKTITSGHVGPITGIACNPKYAQFVTTCKDIALWTI